MEKIKKTLLLSGIELRFLIRPASSLVAIVAIIIRDVSSLNFGQDTDYPDFLKDRLCGLVVRVPGYRSSGPGFDSRRYQIF
jgi:hypothetical protein